MVASMAARFRCAAMFFACANGFQRQAAQSTAHSRLTASISLISVASFSAPCCCADTRPRQCRCSCRWLYTCIISRHFFCAPPVTVVNIAVPSASGAGGTTVGSESLDMATLPLCVLKRNGGTTPPGLLIGTTSKMMHPSTSTHTVAGHGKAA